MRRTIAATLLAAVTALAVPSVAGATIPDYRSDPNCDDFCAWRWEAYGALERGVYGDIVWAGARAYGVPELTDWMHALIRCENGGDYFDHAGFYVGATQQDPDYWWARAAAAGFGATPPTDPVANIFVAFWMAKQTRAHWPNCP